ncbi:MAG: Uma2 family endonuclease [Gammaproteobacteria bacterium]|nr:Uma2 family endonuclease [Gammaproteobacteria bacterium]
MNLSHKAKLLSVQDYLKSELTSPVKREFINGDVYAMAGASTNHNRIVANILRELGVHLKNTSCEPFASDMKLQVADNFFYPDSLVVCDHEANDAGIIDAPLIVVEVLSKSTRQIDHTLKRTAYQQLPSLMEYIVIEQDLVDIEVCRRKNHWQSEHYYLGDEVFFESINLTLSVADIYDRVVNSDMKQYLENLEAEE